MLRQRQPREKTPKHLAFVRSLPCARCLREHRTQAAHVRSGDLERGKRPTGLGEKPSDRYTVPLCGECHLTTNYAQHTVGEEAFWGEIAINPVALADAIWQHRDDYEAARRIIFAFRKAAV